MTICIGCRKPFDPARTTIEVVRSPDQFRSRSCAAQFGKERQQEGRVLEFLRTYARARQPT